MGAVAQQTAADPYPKRGEAFWLAPEGFGQKLRAAVSAQAVVIPAMLVPPGPTALATKRTPASVHVAAPTDGQAAAADSVATRIAGNGALVSSRGEIAGVPCRIGIDLRELGGHTIHRWRLLLVADVLRRLLEVFEDRRVLVAVLDPGLPGVRSPNGWGILPSTGRVTSPGTEVTVLGGLPSVIVGPARPRSADDRPAPWIVPVGAVKPPTGSDDTLGGVLGDHDPAALRLALLRCQCAYPAVLSVARMHRAEETVQRWRFKVAMWHDTPSAPPVESLVSVARTALGAGLDTACVLRELHRLEIDQHVASGSKFATFTYLDRVLGLSLDHLVGKLLR